MGSIVAAVATVHTPFITGNADAAPEYVQDITRSGFRSLGDAILDAQPDVVVAFSSEHVVNLSPRCAPPFLLGIGSSHRIYEEPAFALPSGRVSGHPECSNRLAVGLANSGVDVAHSADLALDHGTVLPLHLMGLLGKVPVVPILINSIFPPLPPLHRCWALGETIGNLVRRDTCSERVALLATGGVSHSVGESRMGDVNISFDQHFVGALVRGDDKVLRHLSDAELDAAGNGTHEVRNWLALRAAIPNWRSELVVGEPLVEGWGTGVYQMRWRPSSIERAS